MKEETINLGIAKIRFKPVEEKKIIIISGCPFCDKKVRGSTHYQVEWNLVLHIKQRHKDSEEARILLKQLEEHNNKKQK